MEPNKIKPLCTSRRSQKQHNWGWSQVFTGSLAAAWGWHKDRGGVKGQNIDEWVPQHSFCVWLSLVPTSKRPYHWSQRNGIARVLCERDQKGESWLSPTLKNLSSVSNNWKRKKLLKTFYSQQRKQKNCQFFNWLKSHGLDSDITWFPQSDGERSSLPVLTCPAGAPDKAEAWVAERQPTYCAFLLPDIRLQMEIPFQPWCYCLRGWHL